MRFKTMPSRPIAQPVTLPCRSGWSDLRWGMPPPGETEQQVILWNDSVRRNGVVRVFVGPGMRGSGWAGLIDKAITVLNQELSNNGIRVAIRKVSNASEAEATLDITPGSELHAQSFLDVGPTSYLQKVTIKVPATPRVTQRDPKAREVGSGVRLYMLVHELIHTLGLTNAAHSKDDVFTKKPDLLQKGMVLRGKMVTEDSVRSYDLSAVMPPIVLGASTLANLKRAWP
jgi:hypothetical protein